MEIVKLKPVFKNYLWGGHKLESFNKHDEGRIIAESWEASIHKDGLSLIDSGSDKGKTFLQYLNEHKEYLGKDLKEFPILIKFINSLKPLSVQVHPNDEYALKYENDHGKTECWYIVDADEGSFIYLGVKRNITKQELKEKINDGTLTDVLNKVYVKKGDLYLIEAGTIHSIGEGVVILETQQSSNVTYRLYDYKRKDEFGNERKLHIDKALDVAVLEPKEYVSNSSIKTDYFDISIIDVKDTKTIKTGDYFNVITVVDGSGNINSIEINKGDTLFIPYGIDEYILKGNMKIIKTTKLKVIS